MLESPDRLVRYRALSVLHFVNDRRALEPLVRVLQKDPDSGARVQAADALGQLEPLIKRFAEVDPRTSDTGGGLACPPIRTYALQLVAKAGRPEHVPFLLEALKDPFEDVRLEAVRALWRLGDPRAVPALIAQLRAPQGRFRLIPDAIARALGNIGDAWAVGPLIDAIATWSNEVTSGHGDVPPGYDGHFTRRRAFWETNDFEQALIRIGGPSVKPLLAEVNGPREKVRFGAIRVLGQLRDRRAVEPLKEALGDPDKEIRRLAIAALGEIGDPRAVAPLLEIAATKSDPMSSDAADALWVLGPEAVDELIAALDHPKPVARQQAASALKMIADPRGLEAVRARGIDPRGLPSGAGTR